MSAIVSIAELSKTYADGPPALDGVSLDIRAGEVFALLGPNGAGKTTLISITCGLTTPTSGRVTVGGHDVVRDWRKARALVGLVPQEVTLEPFTPVGQAVRLSRGLFGMRPDPARVEELLRRLSLWEKRAAETKALSGGMKRRVMIAKALAHEPRVLFLDEPTAGVDVELRQDMWTLVRELQAEGVTIVLTTHYIEEAEAIADRVGVISGGRLLLVEETKSVMRRLGRKRLRIELREPLQAPPAGLDRYSLEVTEEGWELVYAYDTQGERTGIASLLGDLSAAGVKLRDIRTEQDRLEDIFVGLLRGER